MYIGIDIVEISRIKKLTERKNSQLERFFTAKELSYCRSRGTQESASLAGIFSAKEAFVKALGTGFRFGRWTEIEIGHNEWGAPVLHVTGTYEQLCQERKIQNMAVSISHCRTYAIAQVVLEG